MSLSLRYFRLLGLLGVTIALMGADTATAGWMGFRNDTKETIVLQETIVVGGQARTGRPQRLFAGEAVRDTPAPGGQRKFTIFDPAKPNQPLFNGNFPCPNANENILYSINSDGKGGVTIEAVRTPAGAPPKN